MNKLGSFQMKCIRRILKTPPTFIDRTQTNQIVRDRAKSYNVDVTEISVVWKKQNSSCLGTYLEGIIMQIRLDKSCLDTGLSPPRILPTKGVGRPKLGWLNETAKDAVHALGRVAPPHPNQADIDCLAEAAILRRGPFKSPEESPAILGHQPNGFLRKYKEKRCSVTVL